MNLRKINKKAGLESEGVIVWIIVIAVVIMAIVFVTRMNWDLFMKNLPGVKGAGEEDRTIDIGDDSVIGICPEGYEIIGELSGTRNPYSFFIKEGSSMKNTNLNWNLGSNKIEIQKWGFLNDIRLGDKRSDLDPKTQATYSIIEINPDSFKRYSSLFLTILKEELKTNEEIFKTLFLIDKALIKGNNQICQKTEKISEENMRAEMNLIYWGVKEPKIINLIEETTSRIQEDSTVGKGYFRLDLGEYISETTKIITYLEADGRIKIQDNRGLYIKKEENNLFLYLASKPQTTSNKLDIRLIGGIYPNDGRVIIFCKDTGELQGQNSMLYSLELGTIRLPDKVILEDTWMSSENAGYVSRCNTTLLLSPSAIYIAMNPQPTSDFQKESFDAAYYTSSGANSVPTSITFP